MNDANNAVSILVPSFDSYSDIWPVFFKAFFDLWPECPYKIYLGTNYKQPNIKGVSVISIGEDKSYCENLEKMMDVIDTDYIMLWVDDLILTDFDVELTEKVISLAIEEEVDYLNLLPNYPLSYSKKKPYYDELPLNIKYRIAIGISFFRKSLILNAIGENKSAWDLEYNLPKTIDESVSIFALRSDLKKYPIDFINAVEKGKLIRNSIRRLSLYGESKELLKREKQSFTRYLYYRLFTMFFKMLTLFKIHLKQK